MDGHVLLESEEKEENVLGVTIQCNLKWDSHIKGLLNMLKDRLYGLSTARNYVSKSFRKVMVEGLFMSVMTYCVPVWEIGDIYRNFKY